MQLAMVIAAQSLATERARLCKFKVMRIAGRASAHKAGL
jgi:hypothetical protein